MLLDSESYKFIHTDKILKDNICLLVYGGSHAYGTNIEDSDIDLRGIYLNTPQHLLGVYPVDDEQYTDAETDTCIYSMEKMFNLLSKCNPNVIEILGCRKQDYFILDEVGEYLIDNNKLFLSKSAYYTFASYAQNQLVRLENALAGKIETPEAQRKQLEESLKRRITNLEMKFKGQLNLSYYVEDGELRINLDTHGIKSQVASQVFSELVTLLRNYKDLGKRNTKKTDKGISKHLMHLYRLYFMCMDILEKQEINTYRLKEHDFLMAVRNGEMQLPSGELKPEAIKVLEELRKATDKAFENTTLPEKVDIEKLNEVYSEIVLHTLRKRGRIK